MASILLLFLLAWFLALTSMVFYRLLTGNIATRGLLCDLGEGTVSPERVQMLVGTIGEKTIKAILMVMMTGWGN